MSWVRAGLLCLYLLLTSRKEGKCGSGYCGPPLINTGCNILEGIRSGFGSRPEFSVIFIEDPGITLQLLKSARVMQGLSTGKWNPYKCLYH